MECRLQVTTTMALPSAARRPGLGGVDLALGETAGDGLQLIHVVQVGFVGEHGHEQVVAHGGLAQGHGADARRSLGQQLEIGLDLVVVGQVAVAAQLEAQELVGGLQGLGRQGQDGQEQDDKQRFFHGASSKVDYNPFESKKEKGKSKKTALRLRVMGYRLWVIVMVMGNG